MDVFVAFYDGFCDDCCIVVLFTKFFCYGCPFRRVSYVVFFLLGFLLQWLFFLEGFLFQVLVSVFVVLFIRVSYCGGVCCFLEGFILVCFFCSFKGFLC